MKYKVQVGDVVVNLIPLSDKVPKKAVKEVVVNGDNRVRPIKWQPMVVPFGAVDRGRIDVRFEGDKLVVQAPDIPANRKILEVWDKIKSLKGKEIEVGSREDEEYTRFEVLLYESELGRVLLNTIRVENDAAEKVAKFCDVDEAAGEFEKPLHPPLPVLVEKSTEIDASLHSLYECPSCKCLWKGEELSYNLCPKCNVILDEVFGVQLKDINAELVGKRVRVKAVLEGEGEAKALFIKWKAICQKCSASIEIDFSKSEFREYMFLRLISEGRFGEKEVLQALSNYKDLGIGVCSSNEHFWEIESIEPAVDYREVFLRDELILEEKDEKGSSSRNYKTILFGPSPSSQKINVSGLVLINPKNNALTLVIYAYENVDVVKPTPLTEDEKTLLRKYFHKKSFVEWLEDSEKLVCPQIVGREEAKLASLLTVTSPLWMTLDGNTRVPGVVRTMFIGDARTGKGSIGRWYPNVVGVGLHGSAETATRAGIGYYVDPEEKVIVWGLLVEADCGLAVIEALHGFPPEHLMQLREALAQMKIEVRMKSRGVRFARTRIIADANAPETLASYPYPCLALRDLRCFLDPSIDPSRWDIFVPFRTDDIPEDEIVSNQRSEDQEFIQALRRLIALAWSRKAVDFMIEEEARSLLRSEAARLMREYRLDGLPIVHNGSHWSILRLAHSFAVLSLSTEDFQTFSVKKEHIELAVKFLEHLYELWSIKEYKSKSTALQLTDEKFKELKEFFEKKEGARRLFTEVALNPADGETLAGRAEVDYDYARKLLSEMKRKNIIERSRGVYRLTELGKQLYTRLENIKQTPSQQKKDEVRGVCEVCGKETERFRISQAGKMTYLCSEECENNYPGRL